MADMLARLRQALGHSIIDEELKGDFAVAGRLADEMVEKARRHSDPATLGEALLERAKVDLLRGRPRRALDQLDEAESLVTDPGPRLSIAGYRMIALPEIRAATRHEASLLYRVLSDLPMARYLTARGELATPEQAERRLQVALRYPLSFLQDPVRHEMSPAWLAFTQRVIADLFWRARQPDPARQLLARAYDLYSESDDPAGMATCRMTWGDWLAGGSPRSRNFPIREIDWSDVTSWLRESKKLDALEIDATGSDVAYSEAEALTAKSSPRFARRTG